MADHLFSETNCRLAHSQVAGWSVDGREQTLFQRFNRNFVAVCADHEALFRQARQIRYQVYCVENAFENPARYPNGLESDEFDEHSAHSLLFNRPTGEPIGTVRLILPRADHFHHRLPVYRLCDSDALEWLPILSTAEVSRFSISKQLRSRYEMDPECPVPIRAKDRLMGPMPRLGLIQALVRMSIHHGISHWCAVMEPSLLRVLAAMGIHFDAIGPLIEYHGLRQPSSCCVVEMLARAKREKPAFWEVITDRGVLYHRLLARDLK